MIIKKLYSITVNGSKVYYHQKSRTFLYPLLGISAIAKFKPLQTYIDWIGYVSPDDVKLVAVYNTDYPDFNNFENTILFRNPLFSKVYTLENNQKAYIFDFKIYESDWNHFLNGSYSKFSFNNKTVILKYYSSSVDKTGWIESFLYPESYHEQYAGLLADPDDIQNMLVNVKSSHELCNKYDSIKERLIIFPIEEIND